MYSNVVVGGLESNELHAITNVINIFGLTEHPFLQKVEGEMREKYTKNKEIIRKKIYENRKYTKNLRFRFLCKVLRFFDIRLRISYIRPALNDKCPSWHLGIRGLS